MSLRRKTLIAAGLTTLIVIGVFYLSARLILLKNYEDVEEQTMRDNIERTRNALDGQLEIMTSSVGDWSYWNDTYNYMRGDYPDYIEANIFDANYISLDVNGMLFIDKDGNLLFGQEFDGRSIGLSDELREAIYADEALIFQPDEPDPLRSTSGILMLSKRPVMIASRAVLTGNQEGPLAGTLIWIRYLESNRIADLAAQVKFDLSLYRLDQALPSDVQAIRDQLSVDQPDTVQVLNQDRVAGYALVNDLNGNPAMILRIEVPRTLYQQGARTILYFILFMLVLAGVAAGGLLILVERFILSRLSRLNDEVRRVGSRANFSERITVVGDDEIAELAGAINHTFAALEKADIALRQAKESAEEANLVKSRFLASMSHELRTPMNAILNFSEFMVDGFMGPVTTEQSDALKKVIASGDHLLSLINDVLDITKIEVGMMELFIEKVDLNAALDSVMATAKGLMRDKSITLQEEIQANLPILMGDKRRIRQVFLNLLSNAIKFTAEGSIMVTARQEGQDIHFMVKDTGVGITPEDQHLVFEAFRQTRHGIDAGGTGLGMPISKHLVETHGGRMWLESVVGKGTTFHVVLPIHSPEAVIKQKGIVA